MLSSRQISDNVGDAEIDRFINYFWKNEKGAIDLKSFTRKIEQYELKIERQNNPYAVRKANRAPISDKIIEKKQQLFKYIDSELKAQGISLRSLFTSIDVDHSNSIEADELARVIMDQMKISYMTREEIKEIFRSIDLDGNGKLTWGEFSSDFTTTINWRLH
jgi:Ca2+-binding EF-hand superfamily protein